MSNNFDYYYGNEAEQFSFLRVPKLLIKDERFKGLSSDAKLLYGLMLDRMSLSMKNGWFDDQNRAYIIYTIENIMEDLGCATEKCTKILAELDNIKGIGLIERKKQGLGKPAIIYVKNFTTIEKDEVVEDNENISSSADVSIDFRKSKFKTFENRNSRLSKIEIQDFRKSKSNNTNINNTDISYTNPILSIYPDTNKQEQDELMDKMDEINVNSYIVLIKENIDYDTYMQDSYTDKKLFEELFQVICEIVCVKRDTIRIGGYEYPYELVRARFLKLKSSHLQYVIDCIKNTPNKIKNVKAYMVASLYNAPTTMNTYFENWVNTDMMDGRV